MKRIIVCLNNEDYLLRIEDFCQEEKLDIARISCPQDLDEDPYIVVITDKDEYVDEFSIKGKLCLVSDAKPVKNIFYLKETFSVAHLRMLLDMVYHGVLLSNYAPSLMPYVFHKEYTIANDFYNIDRLVYAMTAELVIFFKFCELEKIRVGMSEMITNAIEHGNLGITAEEKFKATEEGVYYDMLNERMSDPAKAARKTNIKIDFRDDKLTVKITDEGSGFDTTKLPSPTDKENLMKLHGRGIFITRIYFTDIKYNDKGNEVTLIKDVSQDK